MAVDDHFARHWQGFAHLICIVSGKRESVAAYTSTLIHDSERTAALGRKAQGRALSTAGDAQMLEGHAELFGERHHSAEFHTYIEAIELSKKSRVAEAL